MITTGQNLRIKHKKSTNTQPLVSVIMPVHNASLYLREAINSIVNQTYKNIEFIIVDDGSHDKSWKIIQSFKQRFPKKIKAIHLKKALGKSGDPASNIAIMKAKGTFIAKMDADDIAKPTRIAKQVEFFQKNPAIFLAGTQAYVINKEGKTIGKKRVPEHQVDIFKDFFLYSYFIHPSIMFRNENKGQPFYLLKFPYFNEYYTFFKLMTQGYKFANLPEFLLYYRIHGANDTLSNTRKKFLSTLRMRWEFIKLGYNPNFRQLLITILQALAVFILPERAIPVIYLLSRNVITPKQLWDEFKEKISFLPLIQRRMPAQA